ncbi:MAG: ATP-binding cassette domain-containing protein [Actinomycetaceae bacterium]|nr:ATP-binding cassette domain-containing protein [Arcanobacterium sp.]MDD7504483.1 ATP-binding cassette domain-containing protein [Actinomycetaceae bacterium]MDY6142847.1 ATP-binding cassette domain-containing protein [Arcanobacterium sp.]
MNTISHAGSPHRLAKSDEVLSAQNVSVVLAASPILTDISFTVNRGEVVALMGPNGSGKSTLIRTLLGIYKPTQGSVRLFGYDHTSGKVPFGKIGYVPQRVNPDSGIPATAVEVVRSGLLSRGRLFADRGRKAKAAALQALKLVGLEGRANDHVQVFSGGQAQRLGIARALVRKPELLLLDEPLAGVDAASRETVARILSTLRDQSVTHVIVLHEMGELAPLIDRVIYLADGKLLYNCRPPELPATINSGPVDHIHSRAARHHAPRLTGN